MTYLNLKPYIKYQETNKIKLLKPMPVKVKHFSIGDLTKGFSSGYLMVDLCLAILSLSLCILIVSNYLANLSLINKHTVDLNSQYKILRSEVDHSVSLMSKPGSDKDISNDPIVYEKDGYLFEKRYTLLDDNFKMYRLDISAADKKRTYKTSTYFIVR